MNKTLDKARHTLLPLLAALISTVIGTVSAIALYRSRPKFKKAMLSLSYIPMMNSDIVTGVSLMMLFTFLWSLLFVIPGIVKAYSYALTPYILAKYPEVQAKEALKVSMKIMDGKKAELFVLHLSFIGWAMLAGITFGLLGIFFVIPYMAITDTLWYKRTMESAIETGLFSYTPVE